MRAESHVVIVGGGFAGLYAARALRDEPVRVTLVDRRNHHLFQPLLYQVATASLNPADIASPIRAILRRQRNVTVLLGDAVAIDAPAKTLRLGDGALSYDFLVLATGATHAYFGHDEWAAFAPGLKTIEDALEIRRRVLLGYEEAEREPDPARRAPYLTSVVIGGGPTGVELAGALVEIARHSLARDFRNIDPAEARVVLVEASPRLLGAYPERLSERARGRLERIGVDVRAGTLVTAIDAEGVSVLARGQTERIAARTVLWAAGVAASPLARALGAPLDRAGRVLVRPDLSVPGHPQHFVAGDLAAVEHEGGWVPGIAPAAIQMGRHAARNVVRALRGEASEPFRYFDKGSFATIGRGAAIGLLGGRVPVWGFLAWLAWLFIHILYLIGFRNRLLVLFQWAYQYFTWRRGTRLITGGEGAGNGRRQP